ncbi:hypothetical protein [Alteribacter natronophilus]|uniref:hypothetical protein n=1 Tax=Alteribacter natronophilus TaxID=2583810 RepID=UPI00110D257D|nr:hypothetical protein [Alteribacter natronophilus]TMW70337.1 hypothetical protein FGB90_16820 [Alteribacter natronophilus]
MGATNLIIVLGLIILAGVFLMIGKSQTFGVRPGMRRVRNFVLAGYGAVLAASVLIVFLFHSGGEFHPDDYYEAENEALLDRVSAGNLNQIDEKFLRGHYTFTYVGNELDLEMLMNSHGNVSLVTEPADGNNIELYHFSGSSHINGYDITDRFEPFRAGLNELEEQLWVSIPEDDRISVSIFEAVFPARQFADGGVSATFYSDYKQGPHIIYLKIPENISFSYETYDFFDVTEVEG